MWSRDSKKEEVEVSWQMAPMGGGSVFYPLFVRRVQVPLIVRVADDAVWLVAGISSLSTRSKIPDIFYQ